MQKRVRSIKKAQLVFSVGFLLMGLVMGLSFRTAQKVSAASCDKVNIVYCGLTGSDLGGYISSVKQLYAANSDNGHSDIRQMLEWGGFTSDVVNAMDTNNSRIGTLHRDGAYIEVGGVTVATNVQISARFTSGAGFTQVKSGVWSRSATNMVNATDQVIVTFDADGRVRGALVIRCGNTLQYTPVLPVYSCDLLAITPATQVVGANVHGDFAYTAKNGASLNSTSIDWGDGTTNSGYDHTYTTAGTYTITGTLHMSYWGTGVNVTSAACAKQMTIKPVVSYDCTAVLPTKLSRLEWTFKVNAFANSASITSYSYNYGDGVKETSTSNTADHTYKTSGTYKVNVTVTFSTNGTAATKSCSTSVTVEKPVYKCEQLTGPNQNLTYTFVATATTTEGAALMSGDFDFGDGKTATNQKADGNTVTVQHTYAKEGTYSVGATLKFTVDGVTTSAATCRATVTPQQPAVPECKPGIPVGDKRCTPCQYDVNLTSDDTRCQPSVLPATTTLPNTGAGNVVLVSLVALIGGFLFYRHRLFMKHKKDFVSADAGSLPLPLADPLSDQPLDGTPLAEQPVRSTLRRRRQF